MAQTIIWSLEIRLNTRRDGLHKDLKLFLAISHESLFY